MNRFCWFPRHTTTALEMWRPVKPRHLLCTSTLVRIPPLNGTRTIRWSRSRPRPNTSSTAVGERHISRSERLRLPITASTVSSPFLGSSERASTSLSLSMNVRIFLSVYTGNSVNVFFNSFPKMIQNGLNQWWWVGAIRLTTFRLFSGSIHSRPSLDFRSFNADLHSRAKRLPDDPAKMYTRMNLLIIWNKSIIWFKFVNQDETVWDVDTFRQIDRKGHIALEPLTIYIKNGGEGERIFFLFWFCKLKI